MSPDSVLVALILLQSRRLEVSVWLLAAGYVLDNPGLRVHRLFTYTGNEL